MSDERTPVPNRYAVIEVGTSASLRSTLADEPVPGGLGHELSERLNARVADRVTVPSHESIPDFAALLFDPFAGVEHATALSAVVGGALAREEFPLVLGRDRSILPGGLLALQRRGRYALLYVSGELPFRAPVREPGAEVSPAAVAITSENKVLRVRGGERDGSLMNPEDVVAFGIREDPAAPTVGPLPPASVTTIDVATIRRSGLRAATARALVRLTSDHVDGFWIHFETSAIDAAQGLTWNDAQYVLTAAFAADHVVGSSVAASEPSAQLLELLISVARV